MEMTSTEETSLESEYENQKSYLTDPSKLIYLVADLNSHTSDLPGKLAGDVNLFFGKENELPEAITGSCAELSIMIADKDS